MKLGARLRPTSGNDVENKKVREQMKSRAEKIGKFRFKMNFGLDSGLFVSSAARRATLSTAIKADDHAGRVFPRPVYHGPNGGIAEMNCFNSSGVTPAVMMCWSALIGSMERNKAVLMMVMAIEKGISIEIPAKDYLLLNIKK